MKYNINKDNAKDRSIKGVAKRRENMKVKMSFRLPQDVSDYLKTKNNQADTITDAIRKMRDDEKKQSNLNHSR
jgi:hypothetical protein